MKLHLYYKIGVFAGFAVALVLLAFMVLCAMVGIMDKENVDLMTMFVASILVTLGLALLLTIGIGILTCEYICNAESLAIVELLFFFNFSGHCNDQLYSHGSR